MDKKDSKNVVILSMKNICKKLVFGCYILTRNYLNLAASTLHL